MRGTIIAMFQEGSANSTVACSLGKCLDSETDISRFAIDSKAIVANSYMLINIGSSTSVIHNLTF